MNFRPETSRLPPECDEAALAVLASSLQTDFVNGRVSEKLFAHRSRVVRQQGARLKAESLKAAAPEGGDAAHALRQLLTPML